VTRVREQGSDLNVTLILRGSGRVNLSKPSIQWETDLFHGSVYSRTDYIYKSAVNSSSEIDPRHDQPILARINLKLGWRSADWDISLGVKNLTNEEYVDQSANANVLTPIDAAVSSQVGSYQKYIGDPGEVTLSMRLIF
jgi:outer membrane receptor protein involved in Fe transport